MKKMTLSFFYSEDEIVNEKELDPMRHINEIKIQVFVFTACVL